MTGALLGLLVVLAMAPAAGATVVYVRPAVSALENGPIVAAHDDGSGARVIARGHDPSISPDGKRVVYFTRGPKYHYPERLRVVSIHGGRSRLLFGDAIVPGPPAWSPDSRHIAVGNLNMPRAAALVIDVVTGTRRFIPLNATFGGASFSPDGTRLIVEIGRTKTVSLEVAPATGGRGRELRFGGSPIWTRAGIVFAYFDGIKLLRRPRSKPTILYPRPATDRFLWPVATSGDRRTVLVGEGQLDTYQAVLIVPQTRAVQQLPTVFSELDAVSHDGKVVLGVANGNVISVARDGTTHLIATGANSASWND